MHSPPLRKAVTDKRVVSWCCRWVQSPNNVILLLLIIIIITIIIVVLITHFVYIFLNAFTKMSKMLLIYGTNKLSIFI